MYVIPGLDVGGTERQLLHLMRGLSDDYEFITVCTRRTGALRGETSRLSAIRELQTNSGWDPRIQSRIRSLIRAYRPAIVHSFLFGFDYHLNVAARKESVPVVISSRRQLPSWKRRRHVWIQKKANALVDCIIANSQAAADFAVKQEAADPQLFRVIHGGIAPGSFQSHEDGQMVRKRYHIPEGRFVVGMVANFSPVKDHPLFIAAAAELSRRRKDLHFILVGTGALRDRVHTKVRRLGLDSQFSFASTVPELPDLYGVMDVVVLCSQMEGLPNVIMEAMDAGTPVVASAVGGIPELIEDGITGKLVGSRIASDYADAIEAVLDDPGGSARMALRARDFVHENFSIDSTVEAHRSLYRELLNRDGTGGR